jgi:hypothetical protein
MTESGAVASNSSERFRATVTPEVGWVPIALSGEGQLAVAANGLWFASFVNNGVLIGNSESGKPLAFAPFAFDKANALAFDPSSQHLVVIADFTVLVFAIEKRDEGVRLRRELDLPVTGELELVPPVFDKTGRYLVLAMYQGVTVYDFNRRLPLMRVYHGFSSGPWTMGFSDDVLYFVDPTTNPCKCDDYQGSSAAIVSFRLGERVAHYTSVEGDIVSPVRIREANVVSATGSWDAHNGQRRARYRLDVDATVVGIYPFRAQGAAVAIVAHKEGEAYELVTFNDEGGVRSLGLLRGSPFELAVRAQDDRAMFWALDPERTLWFISLANGQERSVTLPERLCIEDGRVVPDGRCSRNGTKLTIPSLIESPKFSTELPVIEVPEGARPVGNSDRVRREGEFDGRLFKK